ncbi:hypothetical protein GGS24DRAFT_514997 [Hypoxylon argillaceum]|nr:hypothetical protein GGS24DRAFT_514997 [Hypoxylon argillaceum]KAI1147659.1 hypothetical protein F4825DRAFT_455242 [Nemania diffusa]
MPDKGRWVYGELGIFPKFFFENPESFQIACNFESATGHVCRVTDLEQDIPFIVSQHRQFLFPSHTHIIDLDCNLLLDIRPRMTSDGFYIYSPTGTITVDITGKLKLSAFHSHSSLDQLTSSVLGKPRRMTCKFKSLLGMERSWVVDGDLRGFRVTIMDEATGQSLASINRAHPGIFPRKTSTRHPCTMKVAANVDVALLLALWICIDDKFYGGYWKLTP